MKMQVTVKNVYGKETIYPFCTVAQRFADLLGTKTLTMGAIEKIRGLGYVVEVVNQYAL